LRLLHVNAIELFYQPNCVLVDLRHSLRASGVTFKYIGGQILSECLGDLAPAGIVIANFAENGQDTLQIFIQIEEHEKRGKWFEQWSF